MRLKPPPLPEGSKEKIYAALKTTRTKSQYQKALCLWMRAALEMTSEQIALALAMSPTGVRKIQARWRHVGNAVFKETGKGGPHNVFLTRKVERAFLDRLAGAAISANAVLDARFIQEEYEKRVGHPVSYPVIYRMLRRHGWRPIGEVAMSVPPRWEAAIWFPYGESAADGKPAMSDAELDAAMKDYDSPERPTGSGTKRWLRL